MTVIDHSQEIAKLKQANDEALRRTWLRRVRGVDRRDLSLERVRLHVEFQDKLSVLDPADPGLMPELSAEQAEQIARLLQVSGGRA